MAEFQEWLNREFPIYRFNSTRARAFHALVDEKVRETMTSEFDIQTVVVDEVVSEASNTLFTNFINVRQDLSVLSTVLRTDYDHLGLMMERMIAFIEQRDLAVDFTDEAVAEEASLKKEAIPKPSDKSGRTEADARSAAVKLHVYEIYFKKLLNIWVTAVSFQPGGPAANLLQQQEPLTR